MDATQMISDSILESDDDENGENENKRGRPLAKLCILKNEHLNERELPLFLGENVLGRDPSTCTLLLPSPSISKQHATISISAYRRRGCHNEVDMEALVWDLGSLNGTRKGRLKLTPNVRYALSECESLVVADIPCQYVSCSADTVFSEDDLKMPISRSSGVKARLPLASEEKEGGTNIGSKKCVDRATEARVSLSELVDTRKTPVRTSCLSFEQTPTQPQGTLVPESDSDEERGGVADRRHKAKVSDSDSCKYSPTCSTFLSPTNKIVPESDDESPIMQPVFTKNRTHRHVSFSKEETDVNVGRQQLKEKKAPAIVDGGEEEERAVLGGRQSEESDHHVPVNKENNVSLRGEDELPVSTPAIFTDAVPAFNMDSDTDMEGEEEGVASAVPVTLNTNQQVDQPSNTAPFHMDSDTDVDEDDNVLDKIPKSVPSSDIDTKPIHVIQREDIMMDSDTDVDDDNVAMLDTASKAIPVSCQSTHTTHSVPSMQMKDFHLNSDTDVDDEDEEKECVPTNTCSKIDKTPSRLDIKQVGPESVPAALHSLHIDCKKDDETICTPAISEPSVVLPVTESRTTADTHADLDILSDSDPEVKDDSPLVAPFAVTTLSFTPGTAIKAVQSDSDADTDVDESSMPPAGDGVNPGDLCVDTDTDVENDVDFGPGEDQVPSLHRENTLGLLVPPLQNCSTPLQLSEGDVEHMETQAFLSPSLGPSRCSTEALDSCATSQTDENFVVAETQSFVCQTKDCQGSPSEVDIMDPTQAFIFESSGDEKNNQAFGLESSGDEKSEQSSRGVTFQLGLSDSSHLQNHAQALAMENTQAFVPVEDTQACAAISPADRAISENDSNLEATQAYGENEEPTRCSATSEGDSKEDFAQEATQAYVSEPYCDSEDGTDGNEEKNSASAGTQPLDTPASSTLVMAETQPMSAFEEDSLDKQNPVSSVLQFKSRPQIETEGRKELGETVKPLETSLSESQLVAETQPMIASHEESSDEDSIPGPRKRKVKPLQLEEEQTQPLTNCELSLEETQPMHISVDEVMVTSGNEDSDKDDSISRPRKRKTKQLEEKAQFLVSSELSSVETQPMVMGKDGESDDEDSIPGPRKRKAKALELEEEETQTLTSSKLSAVETQPMVMGKDGESDDMDSAPGPLKRKGKPAKIQEEETPLLTNFEDSTSETQPLETKTGLQSQRGKRGPVEVGTSDVTIRGKRRATASFREEEEHADCAEPPKRQTRGKSKIFPTVRRRERSTSEEEEDEEEHKQSRKKKSMRQQKSDKEDKDIYAENVSLEEERLREREDFTRLRQQEKGEKGQQKREEEKKIEMERNEKEEPERMQADKPERPRLECETTERETIEGERKNQEEKQKAERMQKDKEQLEKEDKGRLEFEKTEREEKERLEMEDKVRIENERKDKEAKDRLEDERSELADKLERERKEQEHQAGPENETKAWEERESAQNKKQEQKAIKEQQEHKPKVPTRRAARRTAVLCTTEQEQDSTISTIDDVPARRTRSRSNSSNSVSSERSVSLINTQESKGRGRGRGAKRTSEPPSTVIARSSNRRKTVAAKPTEQDGNDISQGVLTRSNSSNSLDSEISSCSLSSQGRVRGGRQSERRRKPEAGTIPPINSHNDHNSAPKSRTRGKKCSEAVELSNTVPHGDGKEKEDSQQARATRGRWRSSLNVSEPADDKDPSNQEEKCAKEESLPVKKNVRARGLKAVTSEAVGTPAVSHGNGAEGKRKGKKRVSETNLEEDSSSRSTISKAKEKEQTGAVEEAKGQRKEEIPVQAKRKGRTAVAIKNDAKDLLTEVEVKDDSGKKENEALEKRGRGRKSAVQKKKEEEEQEEIGTSVQQDALVVESEPQSPTSSVSRKRQAPVDSLPVAKTPRASSASPAASRLSRAANQAYKVLFTGVVDEAGERVLARLGGSMAKGVADMNYLVTDKVRRTVKFLCAVAKGVPIVTTQWLEKSGKAGSFLSPTSFIVKDLEQEKKFNFCLQESLRIASNHPLLQGFEIHVTKSVKPEPLQMKDILTCSGATFLPKMPSSHKPQTVVISCEEDWPLCGLALSASVPVVTAEFILTGILQQKLDYQTHSLCAPASNTQPAGGRGRGRKKT